MGDTVTDEDALRAYLLDVLVDAPAAKLVSEGGRKQAQAEYELKAEKEHPAVASVLREAAWIVRHGKDGS